MTQSRTDNHTYELYGSVLRGTAFENETDTVSYIPYHEDMSPLASPMPVGRGKTAHNRFCYQPMEGQDADEQNGAPSDLTFERYARLASGGAGLVWVEAVSICKEGRSNPYQLLLDENTKARFAALVETIKSNGLKSTGKEPVVLMQMNHSGRYSKPNGTPDPIVAYVNPAIDGGKNPRVACDDYLSALPEQYAKSAKLAEECGFDGVDLKICHGYLLSELMSGYDRSGKYGGSLENRTRLIAESAQAIDAVLGEKTIRAARLNLFDGYGDSHSMGEKPGVLYDLTEAGAVIDILKQNGLSLLNVTMGSPYRTPDVSRPYRRGLDMPKSNSVFALYRILNGAYDIKRQYPELAVVDTGISLLGGMSPFAAAGLVAEGMTDFVGFGRMSFAYPSLARDILAGTFDPKKACVCCGGCSYLKKNVQKSGCIIRNKFYNGIYQTYQASLKK